MILAPILAGVARAVVAGIVFAAFKRMVRSLDRELAAPVKPPRITRARARILTEGERDWSEHEAAHSHQTGQQ